MEERFEKDKMRNTKVEELNDEDLGVIKSLHKTIQLYKGNELLAEVPREELEKKLGVSPFDNYGKFVEALKKLYPDVTGWLSPVSAGLKQAEEDERQEKKIQKLKNEVFEGGHPMTVAIEALNTDQELANYIMRRYPNVPADVMLADLIAEENLFDSVSSHPSVAVKKIAEELQGEIVTLEEIQPGDEFAFLEDPTRVYRAKHEDYEKKKMVIAWESKGREVTREVDVKLFGDKKVIRALPKMEHKQEKKAGENDLDEDLKGLLSEIRGMIMLNLPASKINNVIKKFRLTQEQALQLLVELKKMQKEMEKEHSNYTGAGDNSHKEQLAMLVKNAEAAVEELEKALLQKPKKSEPTPGPELPGMSMAGETYSVMSEIQGPGGFISAKPGDVLNVQGISGVRVNVLNKRTGEVFGIFIRLFDRLVEEGKLVKSANLLGLTEEMGKIAVDGVMVPSEEIYKSGGFKITNLFEDEKC